MEWFFLTIAVIFETFAIITMKVTSGFKSYFYGSLILVFFIFSFYFESLAIKKIDLTIAYSIWVGSGILIIALTEYIFFNKEFSLIGIVSLAIAILSIIIFSFFGYK